MYDPFSALVPDPDGARTNASDILRVIRRRKWLILVTMVIVVGLTLVWLKRITPLYTATTVMMVEAQDSEAQTPVGALAAQEELKIATLVELLGSKNLALKVVKRLDLDDDPEFAPPEPEEPSAPALFIRELFYGKTKKALYPGLDAKDIRELEEDKRSDAIAERLLNQVRVERVDRSHLVNINVTVSSPAKAVRIANAFATLYIEFQISEKSDAAERAIKQLSDRVEHLRVRLLDADRAVAAYERSRDLPAGANQQTTSTDISRLGSQLADARAGRAEAETRYRSIQNVDVPSTGLVTGSSPLLADLRGQEAQLKAKIAQLTAHYGRGHPDVVTATAELSDVQARLADEASRVGKELQGAIEIQRAREGQIASEIGAVRARAFRQSSESVGLMDLEREAETTRTFYVDQLGRLKELIAKSREIRADTRIAAHATAPNDPSYPHVKQILAVATVGSAMLGLLLAFVANMADQSIRTAEQVERLTGVRTLGMLPLVRRRDGDEPHNEVIENPNSVFSEAMRSLYLEFMITRPPNQSQVVVVTSALPGEGKTTVALSLAVSAASIGHSAIVVELDLRRPGVLAALDIPSCRVGILDYLEGAATIDEVIVAVDRPSGLAAICAERLPHDPGALLSSPQLHKLLADLRGRYPLIILNAPPILPVRDAKTLAEIADATLFVVPWGARPDVLRPAVRALKGRITGAVLNKIDYAKHARHAYGDAIQHYGKYSMYYRTGNSDRSRKRGRRRQPEPQPDSVG